MRHSKVEVYVHMVWRVGHDRNRMTDEMERPIYRCVGQETERLRCTIVALGGMPDHVHALVRIHSSVSVARLANSVKGVSSRFVNDQLRPPEYFGWQEGYGAFSVTRSHVKRVCSYIKNQSRHHSEDTVWPEWEETDEERSAKGALPRP